MSHTELFPYQVIQLCHMSSSANVAAPLLPGRCWSQFWPGLFPHIPVTAGARAGQAGTQTTLICSAHSSSYPCLAPPVLSCHIQPQSNLCPKFIIVSLRLSYKINKRGIIPPSIFSFWCLSLLCDLICDVRFVK